MKKIAQGFVCFLILMGSLQMANAQEIDAANSKVTFAVRNMKIRTVKGTFTGMNGRVYLNEAALGNSTFNVCIDAATVDTDNDARDKHLKNEDFFNVTQYPDICFVSERVVQTKANAQTLLVTGQLHMHGVSKTQTITLVYDDKALKGSFTIDRTAYGVGGNGGFSVGKEIKLSIECRFK